MNSSAGCLKSDYSAGMNDPIYTKREKQEGSGSSYSKRQKKQEGSPQVEYYFPGQDPHSGRRGDGRRRSGGRYSLREFRDPRLGHVQFLKDCLFNPLLVLPPEYRPDFIEDPDNPVVGFRLNSSSRLAIPVTALDRARESIQKFQNTPFQPLNYGSPTFPSGFGSTTPLSGYGSRTTPLSGYGSSTGMAPAPPLQEADLVRQILQDREEAAKKLDDRVRDEPEQLRKGDLKLAQEAIKLYNSTHDTSYEVVATLGSYHHLDLGHWLHCNFRARDSKRPSSQPKLFFSELFCPGAEMISAKVCTMLDGPRQRPHNVRGCKICGDQLWHPVNGFECGK